MTFPALLPHYFVVPPPRCNALTLDLRRLTSHSLHDFKRSELSYYIPPLERFLRIASRRSNIDEKAKRRSHKSKTTLLYDHRITTSNGMETKPEKKTKTKRTTTTIIVRADLLRQLHTPSSSSKEGPRTDKQGNKNNAFNAQTTRSSSKNQKGEKKKPKKSRKKRENHKSIFDAKNLPAQQRKLQNKSQKWEERQSIFRHSQRASSSGTSVAATVSRYLE